ncbi:hypothetical protein PHMEG_00036137 [Phytophthora megakarya]|uniref:Reverse transcriptase n=1 Tax=Phytophthora megakarya TaxID=4795 RepID=A0A225UMJ6_9STRA|nr:hypothetical protein PHMEG_00036137 [Phytophthora megakarya]
MVRPKLPQARTAADAFCGSYLNGRFWMLEDASWMESPACNGFEKGIQDIVVVGDSRIVIQQVQGLINCNQPNLQRRLAECETLKKRFQTVRLVHMKREFNQAADYLTSKTLVQEFQAERWRRIKVHQEEDEYLAEIRAFLNDDLDRFSSSRLKKISKVADLFVLNDRGVLYRLPHSVRGRPRDAVDNLRLVVPSSLREDMLHHAHEDFQGRHQGIIRTHEKLRIEFYWPGMYADVQHL